MPHAVSPSSSPAETGDTAMTDAPAVPDTQSTEASRPNVQDIFDDDDDDDNEFNSSAPSQGAEPAIPQGPHTIKASDPETLLAFYSRLFPFRTLFQWLNGSASPTKQFTNREFAFVLPNDAYIRYQSFPTWEALRKQCLQMTPVRFEIGPEYTLNPRDRKTVRKAGAFRPISKELVFDIDMTDYDEIRTCCSGAAICGRCWAFITMAIRVIDKALREDFGFVHLLWVYSGRRGAHCWVSDKRARTMEDQARKAVAGYLELLRGSGQQKRVNQRRPLHPHVERSLELLNPYFATTILAEQNPFAQPQQSERLLSLLGDATLSAALAKKWESSPGRTSTQKWADIDTLAASGSLGTLSTKQLVEVKQDIRLEYTYPRLDAEVSKKLNHLLKSPFVVHPATGRVCVPIDVAKVEEFDPLAVPTVQMLLGEIDAWAAENGREDGVKVEERTQDWMKTSLRPYVEYFKRHVDGILGEANGDRKRDRDEGESMEF